MAVPYTFATATTSIPLSQLDSNFATAITLGNTATYLGNTTTSIGNLTLTNVTVSSGNVTVTSLSGAFNGTVGATTANTGAFTTVSASTSVTTPSVTNAGTLALSATGANVVTASTNGSERMRIDSSGNVGIGTSSPGVKLDVAGNIQSSSNYMASAASYVYSYAGGTNAQVRSGIYMDGTNQILASYTANTERMRIDSSGNLTCAGVYSATVGATNRDVYVDNTGLIGYVSSIRASKTEIQNLADVSWLNQLNPISFKYRKKDEDGNYTDETDGDIQYGMIAEDVEQVRPDLCFYDEVDGEQELRGIQYSKLVPVMLKAIQELNAKVSALEAKLNQGA